MGTKKAKLALGIGTGVGALLLVAGGASVIYASQYDGVALPNVTGAGEAVTGKTEAEIVALVEKRVADTTVKVDIDGTTVAASLPELGVSVDAKQIATTALAGNGSYTETIGALLGGREVPIQVKTSDEKIEGFLSSLLKGDNQAVKEAAVTLAQDGSGFVVEPGKAGRSVEEAPVRKAVQQAATTLTSQSVVGTLTEVEPTFTTGEAEAAAESANKLLAMGVEISDGTDTFTAGPEVRAQWIAINQEDGSVAFDDAKVTKWVAETAEKSNVKPTPGIDNVDAAGKVLVEAKPGIPGYQVNNLEKVTKDVLTALKAGHAYTGEFDYDKVKADNEKRPVIPGAEKDQYPAAKGEKWLEVNLADNSVSGYVGRDRVHGPVPVVPGKPGHETVTGLFHVYLQYEKQDMGCTPDWPYCAKDVPWVTYFHESYAFHGAPWQDSFGWSGPGGSHGCLNMPVNEAQWVYEFAEQGTPVISHY